MLNFINLNFSKFLSKHFNRERKSKLSIKLLSIITLFFISSCAYFQKVRTVKSNLSSSKKKYNFVDRFGKYTLEREVGTKTKSKEFVVKSRILDKEKKKLELERSITISRMGSLKGKLSVLRPEISQYTVWYDKKKYFSEIKLLKSKKSMQVRLESPEDKWNNTNIIPFPKKGTGVFCFFGQLIECAKYTGFLQKAISLKAGEMSFYIVWDGYPYINDQYEGLKQNLFSRAKLVYDGDGKDDNIRFSLMFDSQTIFYIVNDEGDFQEMYWVAQGMSVVQQ